MQEEATAAPRSTLTMQAIRFTLSTGSYRLNTLDAQRLVRALEGVENQDPDANPVGAKLKDNLAGELPVHVDLTPNQVEAVLHALEWMMGDEPLSEELYALRDGLLKEPT